MHGQLQGRRRDDQVAEDEILKPCVLFCCRHAAIVILAVDRLDGLASGIAERQRSEVRGLEFHGHTTAPLVFFETVHEEEQVVAERLWQRRRHAELLRVALEQLRLQRHVDGQIGIGRHARVVERKHEAVDEEDPFEAGWIQVRRHRDAIGHRGLDAEAIKNAVEIRGAWPLTPEAGLPVHQPTPVRAIHVGVREAEQGARRCAGFRILRAQAQRRRARRRRRNIHVGIVGKCRMRVMVEDLDARDLRQ